MSLKPTHPIQLKFLKLKWAEVKREELKGRLMKLHIFLLAFCCCRLLVQMEEDEEVLEFRASAGDLLRAESEKEVSRRNLQQRIIHTEVQTWCIDLKSVKYFRAVILSGRFSVFFLSPQPVVREFDIIKTFQLRNNSEMLLNFRLRTRLPFLVLKPQPRVQTNSSSNPRTGVSQSLGLKPQQSMQVRPGEAAMF